MNIVAIIQARMGSSRLQGKVLKEVMSKPLLEYQLQRVKKSELITDVVVATTLLPSDDLIIDLCNELNIKTFRGPENNVLERYYQAAREYDANIIVRMTGDCPLIDPFIIDKVIDNYIDNEYDYVSNTQIRTYPRGMDVEVFSGKALKSAYDNAKKGYEKEHVTPYIYLNKRYFNIGQVQYKENYSKYRLTVDTAEDFNLISEILKSIYPNKQLFTLNDIIYLLEKEPELIEINKHVKQKKLGE
ncbi:glycosyltransferase family protein [Gracilibacillus sp. YIM 98692]|uniref:cytidylyltransferase domain-containing protein n=1 Tax=Gracilibacillus sp. YIM 98692 TaxID=2663532 RepID=UPI0013D7576B|nr:glycosyltransferase family protein [Gracilibacillus sp. YIM 98692]